MFDAKGTIPAAVERLLNDFEYFCILFSLSQRSQLSTYCHVFMIAIYASQCTALGACAAFTVN